MAATGTEITAAVKKAAAWGTAVAVGASDGILLTRDAITKRRGVEVDESAGQAFAREADRGNIVVGGDLTAWARYDGLATLLALAMGTAGAPTQQEATAAYKHILQLATNTDGKFATYVRDLDTQIQECPSLKVLGFDLAGEAGQPCTLTFPTAADDLLLPAVTNTSVASVTYRDRGNRILFSQAVFRCNAQGGAALGSGDVIKPASFRLACRLPLTGDYLAGNADKIAEPVRDGPRLPEITLTLQFPQFSSASWNTAFQADARQKLDIIFTGGLIEGAYHYSLVIPCPHVVVEESTQEIPGAGKIPNPVTLRLLEAAAAPTGMTYTAPITLELINRQTTNPLG